MAGRWWKPRVERSINQIKEYSPMDEEPEAKAAWNNTEEYLKIMLHNVINIQSTVGYVKIFDKEAFIKILPMIEVTYELIRPPLKQHYSIIMQEIDIAIQETKKIYERINPLGYEKILPGYETKQFIEGIEYCYRRLNEAIYILGLGILIKKGISMREKMERALLD